MINGKNCIDEKQDSVFIDFRKGKSVDQLGS
nr:MAG TPA: hypothetical protein [Caudoviricetes sp.]